AGQGAVLSGSIVVGVPEPTLDPETVVWRDRITAAGAAVSEDSITLADNLIKAITATSWGAKIVYLLPFLGEGIAAAMVPLRDSFGVGAATNTDLVDADFSEGAGIRGDGSTKRLTVPLKPSQLGSTNNG